MWQDRIGSGGSIFTAKLALGWLLGLASAGFAQPAEHPDEPPTFPYPPIRLEVGGYGLDYGRAGGWWRDADATLWVRSNRYFVPALTVDSRMSDSGSATYYSFFSYANWTANFYTTQAISGSPSSGPVLFPRLRYDVKAWWKIPPRRRVVAGVGFTQFSFRNGSSGQIVNPGAMYYAGPVVLDVEAFVNRSQPGNLWSGAGLVSVQRGREGHQWVGVSLGGGRQVYRALAELPLETRFASVSADVFYRRWLSRHFGIAVSGGYQNAYGAYHRFGAATHLFFDF